MKEFFYKDKVIIKHGFYRGVKGIITFKHIFTTGIWFPKKHVEYTVSFDKNKYGLDYLNYRPEELEKV